jgi:DnaJ-class molecular chaperone
MAEVKCGRCDGEGWAESIGPHSDGSYITSRRCPRCGGRGRAWVGLVPAEQESSNVTRIRRTE